MSQSQDSSLMEDELTCPICLDIFAQPQMLCCGHNFCASCLEDVLRKQEETGSYKCPECAWDFQERPSPKRNFKLAGIVERFQASQRSSAGTQRPLSCDYCPCAAERTCLKCESNFCSDHLRPHLEKPSLRLHRLAEPSAERGDQCQEHDEVCKMFCSSCKQCVCTCCVLEARHHKHHITSFKHAQQGIKDWLEGRLQRLTARLEVCEGSLGQQCLEEEQVKTELEGLRQRGRQCCEGLRRAVEDYQAQLEQCLDREEQGALEELQKMAILNQGQRESLAELCTSLKLLQEERDPLHCIQVISQRGNSHSTPPAQDFDHNLGF
ncbi:TRIM8 ligase, partial [Amia calva]|nr:TRIM8 ligase [Amia calva]